MCIIIFFCSDVIRLLHSNLKTGDATNLAILEEMLRDPYTTLHAEDLQAGSSYNIPKLSQQVWMRLSGSGEGAVEIKLRYNCRNITYRLHALIFESN